MNSEILSPSTGNQGVTVNHDLRGLAIGQVHLTYKGLYVPSGMQSLEIECEVYEVDGILSVHTVCPKCRHSQWIDGRNKDIEYDAQRKTLRVEAFRCPWEMDDERKEFGMSLCRLVLAFTGRVARAV